MSIVDFLLGKPIPSSEERGEQIGVAAGVPIFGLDALSSAAYGPEAALTLLIPLGVAGLAYIVPLSASIIALLIIVFSPTGRPSRPIPEAEVPIRLPMKTWARSPGCSLPSP